MDGSISYRSFISGCEYIVQKSKKLGLEWQLKASQVSFNSSDHIHFEYHIIYNVSYSVPVLYFQATKTDGQSLLLEEVWERVPRSHRDALEGKWSFITQTDHPILGHPVFHIHPCNTATMMRNLLTGELDVKGHQYLLMWLSALGPLVGLEVQNELFVDKQM